MTIKIKPKDDTLQHLNKFIKQNSKTDFTTVNLSETTKIDDLNWKRLGKYKEDILKQLKAYQRLLRIMPEGTAHKIIMSLLQKGIHSAVQIASIPKQQFIATYLPVFGKDKKSIEAFYAHAMAVRSRILIQYMNTLQNNEPHITSTKF